MEQWKKDHKMIKTRKMKNFNEDAFLADVSAICWEQLATESDSISSVVSSWSNFFSLTIDKHAPITEMRVSEKHCPLVNTDLKDLIRNRDRLKKAAVKRKSQILMASYRQVRNKISSMNIQLKKQYVSNRISACQGNMKDS